MVTNLEHLERWAVLVTVHNRADYTLRCLGRLYAAEAASGGRVTADVYLTDDGSTDGTAGAVATQFPRVRILPADGSLFWTRGMVRAWRAAVGGDYDAYLLLNNDTFLGPESFGELLAAQRYMREAFGTEGIAVGCTCQGVDEGDGTAAVGGVLPRPGEAPTSYGGSLVTNRRTLDMRLMEADGTHRMCDFGNANAMLVSRAVVDRIGIMWDGYAHGHGDYEYTHRARRAGLPVVTTRGFCGVCRNDHQNRMALLARLPVGARWRYLWRPSGYGLADMLRFLWRNFPSRIPVVLYVTAKRLCGIDPQRGRREP
ncbi:MAG: glycosyltransferase family 2 protein [Rikenellaceae bacterium]|nr:glycosyltransferase family 2 protein [Rikenellaceae bacterium]